MVLVVDLVSYLRKLYFVFHPRKAYVMENSPSIEELKAPETSPDIGETPTPSSTIEETPEETPEEQPEDTILEQAPETVEVVSPFLDEPIITTNETPSSDDPVIEEIIENIPTPTEIVEENTLSSSDSPVLAADMDTKVTNEEKAEDDTDLIGHDIPEMMSESISPSDSTPDEADKPVEASHPLATPLEKSPERKIEPEKKIETLTPTSTQEKSIEPTLPPEKREKIVEIVSVVKTLIARGQLEDARGLIVSGLALDKNHRELNLLMASLYERDHAYTKAEYIFKDLAKTYPDDAEILEHLATSLAMQHRYELSYELYKKVLSLTGENEEILYTLTHLASELSQSEDVYTYAKSYLKQYPRNPEILWLYTQALISK